MPVPVGINEIVYEGKCHPIIIASKDTYLSHKFTLNYLDKTTYIINPLDNPVKILFFYGSAHRDGLHTTILPHGIGMVKLCNTVGNKTYYYHLSLAGVSVDHQLIRLDNTHESKQIYIISTNTPPSLKSLGTAAVLGLTDHVPRPDTLGRFLSNIPIPRNLINDLCRSDYVLLNEHLGRFSEEFKWLRPCTGCVQSLKHTKWLPAS
jgi:hypothetical protein